MKAHGKGMGFTLNPERAAAMWKTETASSVAGIPVREFKPYKPSKEMNEAADKARAYHAFPSLVC